LRFSPNPFHYILYKQTHQSNASKQVLPSTGAQAGSTGHLAYELFWDNWKKVVEPWLIARHGGSAAATEPTIVVTSPNGDIDIGPNTTGPNTTGPEAKDNVNSDTDKISDDNTSIPIRPDQVMVVSCALYDLGMAKLAGMETVWVKKIHLDDEVAMQAVKTHPFIVNNLEELHNLLFVASDLEGGHEQLPAVPEASDEDENQAMQSQVQCQPQSQTVEEDQVMGSQDQDQAQAAEGDQAMETEG
jgi:hypothetical protein